MIINCIPLLNIHIHVDHLHTQLTAVHVARAPAESQQSVHDMYSRSPKTCDKGYGCRGR